MTARCMSCGDGIEVGAALALMLERAEARLVLDEDSHTWADVLLNVAREKAHRCKTPKIGVVDVRAAGGSNRPWR